jgi:hypothetical protein
MGRGVDGEDLQFGILRNPERGTDVAGADHEDVAAIHLNRVFGDIAVLRRLGDLIERQVARRRPGLSAAPGESPNTARGRK